MLKTYLTDSKKKVETYLETALQSPNREYSKLYEAMKYSLMMGGKRIRPILVMAVMESLGKEPAPLMDMVCAIELVHTYSLIHDDLPAMDNDDYRRGALTNHKVFGDGMAILAGDALLTYAFQLMATNTLATPEQRANCLVALATGSGPEGMVGGQAFDIMSEGKVLPLEELQVLHKGKTGALFAAAVKIGLILGEADEITCVQYMKYADALGLLFQITDDILDVTGTLEELGKMPGSDENLHKATYVSILGLDGAKAEAQRVATEAKSALENTTAHTAILAAIVDYLIARAN